MRYIYIVLSLLVFTPSQAGWIEWSSAYSGTMEVDGTTVNVSLTGNPTGFIDGDAYYNNSTAGGISPTGTYNGMQPSDAITTSYAGSYTLTFDQEVKDLYMAMISIGSSITTVVYDFNEQFDVLSSGPNFWGYTGYSVSGDDLIANEFNGILAFEGSFTSISFNIINDEHWHGFNFAAYSTTVPIPAGVVLFASGFLGVMGYRSRRQII